MSIGVKKANHRDTIGHDAACVRRFSTDRLRFLNCVWDTGAVGDREGETEEETECIELSFFLF